MFVTSEPGLTFDRISLAILRMDSSDSVGGAEEGSGSMQE